jgi:glycosyltransferase involved in cell wall biosynthesis
VLVQNYPRLADFPAALPNGSGEPRVVYAGGINRIRGVRETIAALALLPSESPVRLSLLGGFSDPAFEAELRGMPGWSRVDYLGFLSRAEMVRELARCRAGIVLFLPERDHLDAQPNKLFEYMAAGLPVIASNFPLWRQIVEPMALGICVDPLDPAAIARAIGHLATTPTLARETGARGRAAVEQRLNWQTEAEKLVRMYGELLIQPAPRRRVSLL